MSITELNGMPVIQTGPDTYYSKLVNSDELWYGILEWHRCDTTQVSSEDGFSAGGIYFTNAPENLPAEPRWKMEKADPLTLSPSILCQICGHHGFIQNGQWVPA